MEKFNLSKFNIELKQNFKNSTGEQIFSFLEKNFKIALEMDDNIAIISVGNEFGSYLRVLGNVQLADDVYQLVEKRVVDTFGINSLEYISLTLNIGDVDIVARRYDEAINRFNEAESLLKDFPDETYLKATLHNNRSSAYRLKNKLTESKKDIQIALKLVDNDITKKSISLINLSEVYILLGEFEKAEASIIEALDIFNKISDPIHHANALATAANVYYFKGKYDLSEQYYLQALEKYASKTVANSITKIIETNLERVRNLKLIR